MSTLARLNITYQGQNGDLVDMVPYDSDDQAIKIVAAEAVSNGSVPGITAQQALFNDFVVDRFPSTGEDVPNKLMLRPKTPFGVI